MARQKPIRLRPLPDQPNAAPRGGAAVIDVPFVDLSPPRKRAAPPRRARKPARRKRKLNLLRFLALSAFSAGFVVLAAMAILSGMAQSAPV